MLLSLQNKTFLLVLRWETVSCGDPLASGLVSVLCSAVLHSSASFTSFSDASLLSGWT